MPDLPGTRDPGGRARLDPDRREVYERLRRATDLDAVHDLLATYGPEILDRGLPYLLIAARNRIRSRYRKAATRLEVPVEDVAAEAPASPLWDPYERVAAHDELRRLVEALAALDEEDALVVWRHAQGRSDEEIRREWDELGFEPSAPTSAYVRKRRERARNRLRELFGPRS